MTKKGEKSTRTYDSKDHKYWHLFKFRMHLHNHPHLDERHLLCCGSHVRYIAHIPPSNIIVERCLEIEEVGRVGDERGASIVNWPSILYTNGACRIGRTTFADVILRASLSGKQAVLVSALVGALATTVMARRATAPCRNFGIRLDACKVMMLLR